MSSVTLGNLVSVAVAAKRLKMSGSLVTRYIKQGRLRGSRVPGAKTYVVDVASIEEFEAHRPKRGNPNFGPEFWKKRAKPC